MLSTSPYRFSTQNSQYQNWKATNTGCNKSTAEAWISFCHLNFRHDTCYEQGVPWHSDKYKARRDNNIEEFHIFTKIKNTDGWK